MCRVHVSRRFIADAINRIRERFPLPPEINVFFHNSFVDYPLATWVLLIAARSASVKQRRLLYIEQFLLLYLNFFTVSIVGKLHLLCQGLKSLPAREEVRRRKKHMAKATGLFQLFSKVGGVFDVI